MRSRKTGAKILAFAMVLGAVSFGGFGINKVWAAAPTATFDGVTGIIKVKVEDQNRYFWGVAKPLKGTPKRPAPTNKKLGTTWYDVKELEEVSGGEVDAHPVSKGKAVKIVIINAGKEDDQEITTDNFKLVDIGEADKLFKVTYSADGKGIEITKAVGDADHGYFAFFKAEGNKKKAEQFKPEAGDGDKIQVKKGKFGKWMDLKYYFDGNAYEHAKGVKRVPVLVQNGAELRFRLKADNAWVSKETKVKVSKQAEGPKVTLDVTKGTVSLKKGMKYLAKVEDKGAAMLALSALTNTVSDPKKNDFKTLQIDEAIKSGEEQKDLNFYVASDAKGKKIASKITKILLEKQAVPFINKEIKTEKTLKKSGGAIIGDKAPDQSPTKDDLVSFKLAVPYDPSKGAIIENKSTDTDYEFWVAYDENDTTPKKWISLKRTKDEEKPTKVSVKSSSTKKENTFSIGDSSKSTLYIRRAGNGKVGVNKVKLASAPLDIKLRLDKIAQAVKVTPKGKDAQDNGTFDAEFKGDTEYTFKVEVKDLVNKEASPKLVVKKMDGVAIKAGKFDGATETNGSASEVTIKVDTKKIEKINSQVFEFSFEVEGVKTPFRITIYKDAKQ